MGRSNRRDVDHDEGTCEIDGSQDYLWMGACGDASEDRHDVGA